MSRSKIEAKLKEILTLERSIEDRLWKGSLECTDLDGSCLDEKSIQEKVDSLAELSQKETLNEQLRACIKESNVMGRDNFFAQELTIANEEEYLKVSSNSL